MFSFRPEKKKGAEKRAYSFLSAEHTGARKEKLKMGWARPGGGRIDKNIYTLFVKSLTKCPKKGGQVDPLSMPPLLSKQVLPPSITGEMELIQAYLCTIYI